jgi:hypothetical protein
MEEHTLFAMRVKSNGALSLVFYVCWVQDSKSLNHIVYHTILRRDPYNLQGIIYLFNFVTQLKPHTILR